MTSATMKAAADHREAMPDAKTGGRFSNYMSIIRDAFLEAMQHTYDARRKYPFPDV